MSVKETLKHTIIVLDEAADYFGAILLLEAQDKYIDFKYFIKSKTNGINDSDQYNKDIHEISYLWERNKLEWWYVCNIVKEHVRHEMAMNQEKEELVKYLQETLSQDYKE